MIIPVILAGGSGTRLWPLSRNLYPKQLLRLTGEDTMLQATVARLAGYSGMGRPVVVCNENHRFFVAEQFRESGGEAADILLEPEGRNTAPAVTAAALASMDDGRDPVLCVLPADHYIRDTAAFHRALAVAENAAEQGYLATFGVVPTSPETGYGYIQQGPALSGAQGFHTAGEKDPGVFTIARFVEKPNLSTAESYLRSGDYLWNSGMFLFRASRWLEEAARLAPDILRACRKAVEDGRRDLDFFRLEAAAFTACPSNSVDYAVMERTDKGAVIPLSAGWSDLGSWEALWQAGEKDGADNVVSGDVRLHDSKDSLVHATSRLVAAVGLTGHVVVETTDAVLIAPRNRVQDVKHIVTTLKAQNRSEAENHRQVFRPWGSYESLAVSGRFQVKRIIVKPGARLSSQKHFHRAEHWIVVRGTALVTRDTEEVLLQEDQSLYIPLGAVHRLENPGRIPLELIEVQSGSYLGEDDIVRFDDDYGRKEQTG